MLTILSPGSLTTVQDRGRFGLLASGMGSAGAMDARAAAQANRLVGNAPDAALLEMTFLGCRLVTDEDAILALTGADLQAAVDGQPVPRGRAFVLHAGETLACGMAASGCRGYLAVRGGIDVPLVLGSRSTDLRCRIGGMDGRKLAAGDVLPVGSQAAGEPMTEEIPQPEYAAEITLRVVLGPQKHRFTWRGRRTLLHSVYTVTPDSDRMGLRLQGPAIDAGQGKDILSDGIAPGSIQVSTAGQPILMMADRQTTGGYAKIATVITADLPLAAQARPGTRIRFRAVCVRKAQRIYREECE